MTRSALAIDGLGNAYLGGTTFQADFPVTGGAFSEDAPR